MSGFYIKNPHERWLAQAELDALKGRPLENYAQGDFIRRVALEEEIFLFNQALWCGIDYQSCINIAIQNHIEAGGSKDELFAIISHGIDTELHPYSGCLVQISYYPEDIEDDDRGLWIDEYLYTGLFPIINKEHYKDIIGFLRAHNLEYFFRGEKLSELAAWDSEVGYTCKLIDGKLVMVKNHD